MSAHDFLWYDVFTERAFAGNPLAVFPAADGLGDTEMAGIARELNLSETTFVLAPTDPAATHRVRIYTPARELAFAGHPTVGTAVALAEVAGLDAARFVFELGAGPTAVEVRSEGGVRSAVFVAPRLPALHPSPVEAAGLAALVGLDSADVDTTLPLHVADAGGTSFVVGRVTGLDALARSRPAGTAPGVVGVYLVARDGHGWRTRMFAPAVGVPEDPATGSAACAFAGTLAAHVVGGGTDGTHEVVIRQGVEMGRPSTLRLAYDVVGGAITEVRLAGPAVRVLAGRFGVR